jgi:Fe2+ transport system protein B
MQSSSPTAVFYVLYTFLHFIPQNTNLLFNQLINGPWWLTCAEFSGVYGQDTTTQHHISSHSHKDIINLISVESTSCSNHNSRSYYRWVTKFFPCLARMSALYFIINVIFHTTFIFVNLRINYLMTDMHKYTAIMNLHSIQSVFL